MLSKWIQRHKWAFSLLGLLLVSVLAVAERLSLDAGASFGFVSKWQIGNTQRALRIEAVGEAAVARTYASVGGILIQGTAQPDAAFADSPIRLDVDAEGGNLRVSIGEAQGVSTAPAWVWVTAARFARSKWTAAISLYSDPVTADERAYANAHTIDYWIGYHPAVEDTLMGMFLLAADGMFLEDDPDRVRRLPASITGLDAHLGYDVTFDDAASRAAAAKYRTFLRPIMWETYMMNDVGVNYQFTLAGGKLKISGLPAYRFGTIDGDDRFEEMSNVKTFFDRNHDDLVKINPALYLAVFDFAKHVAFFNYVEKLDPEGFARFVNGLDAVAQRLPTIDTPAAWNPK